MQKKLNFSTLNKLHKSQVELSDQNLSAIFCVCIWSVSKLTIFLTFSQEPI